MKTQITKCHEKPAKCHMYLVINWKNGKVRISKKGEVIR